MTAAQHSDGSPAFGYDCGMSCAVDADRQPRDDDRSGSGNGRSNPAGDGAALVRRPSGAHYRHCTPGREGGHRSTHVQQRRRQLDLPQALRVVRIL
jgi:hypothetical protein